jgi:hypothetical protein
VHKVAVGGTLGCMGTMHSHHAVVFEGDRAAGLGEARAYIEEVLGLRFDANPDISVAEHTVYGVDEARALKERASQTPLGSAQVFVLVVERFTREAQNALLKLLEEPAPATHFILVVSSVRTLLPTVQSRLAYGRRVHGLLAEAERAAAFAVGTIAERYALIAPILDDKDRTKAREFVDALEAYIHDHGVIAHAAMLREIVFVRTYLADGSSSLKMLLEHLAVTTRTN